MENLGNHATTISQANSLLSNGFNDFGTLNIKWDDENEKIALNKDALT